ncbi:MAG: hypothetical protein FWD38_08845 [Oscillospiraceae bacterium]|nr:hypothetical protein [Oscillospiraceae bacterium]
MIDENLESMSEFSEQVLLDELIKDPGNPFLLYQLGKRYFCIDKDFPMACDFFEKALNAGAEPGDSYTYDLVECYGYALVSTGQLGKAIILRDTFSIYYNDNEQFRLLSEHINKSNSSN